MKMKKSDIGVVAVMYAVCIFFFVYMQKLPADSKTYPTFTIALLFGLTTLYVIKMIRDAVKNGTEKGMETFEGFLPVQFFVCIGLIILYLIGIKYIGFFVSTTVFIAVVMLYLKVPKLHIVISVIVLDLLLYFAFVKFLGVKLPKGLLF